MEQQLTGVIAWFHNHGGLKNSSELNMDNWNDNCKAKSEAKSPRHLRGLQVDFSRIKGLELTCKPRKGLKPCLTVYTTYDWELAFHIYIDRETERQRDREIERQRDRETERQRD